MTNVVVESRGKINNTAAINIVPIAAIVLGPNLSESLPAGQTEIKEHASEIKATKVKICVASI